MNSWGFFTNILNQVFLLMGMYLLFLIYKGGAPYIFLLCVEILIGLIRKKFNIKGISVNDKEYLISQYAHDIYLMVARYLTKRQLIH